MKRTQGRRLLSFLIAFAMVFSLVSVPVKAEEAGASVSGLAFSTDCWIGWTEDGMEVWTYAGDFSLSKGEDRGLDTKFQPLYIVDVVDGVVTPVEDITALTFKKVTETDDGEGNLVLNEEELSVENYFSKVTEQGNAGYYYLNMGMADAGVYRLYNGSDYLTLHVSVPYAYFHDGEKIVDSIDYSVANNSVDLYFNENLSNHQIMTCFAGGTEWEEVTTEEDGTIHAGFATLTPDSENSNKYTVTFDVGQLGWLNWNFSLGCTSTLQSDGGEVVSEPWLSLNPQKSGLVICPNVSVWTEDTEDGVLTGCDVDKSEYEKQIPYNMPIQDVAMYIYDIDSDTPATNLALQKQTEAGWVDAEGLFAIDGNEGFYRLNLINVADIGTYRIYDSASMDYVVYNATCPDAYYCDGETMIPGEYRYSDTDNQLQLVINEEEGVQYRLKGYSIDGVETYFDENNMIADMGIVSMKEKEDNCHYDIALNLEALEWQYCEFKVIYTKIYTNINTNDDGEEVTTQEEYDSDVSIYLTPDNSKGIVATNTCYEEWDGDVSKGWAYWDAPTKRVWMNPLPCVIYVSESDFVVKQLKNGEWTEAAIELEAIEDNPNYYNIAFSEIGKYRIYSADGKDFASVIVENPEVGFYNQAGQLVDSIEYVAKNTAFDIKYILPEATEACAVTVEPLGYRIDGRETLFTEAELASNEVIDIEIGTIQKTETGYTVCLDSDKTKAADFDFQFLYTRTMDGADFESPQVESCDICVRCIADRSGVLIDQINWVCDDEESDVYYPTFSDAEYRTKSMYVDWEYPVVAFFASEDATEPIKDLSNLSVVKLGTDNAVSAELTPTQDYEGMYDIFFPEPGTYVVTYIDGNQNSTVAYFNVSDQWMTFYESEEDAKASQNRIVNAEYKYKQDMGDKTFFAKVGFSEYDLANYDITFKYKVSGDVEPRVAQQVADMSIYMFEVPASIFQIKTDTFVDIIISYELKEEHDEYAESRPDDYGELNLHYQYVGLGIANTWYGQNEAGEQEVVKNPDFENQQTTNWYEPGDFYIGYIDDNGNTYENIVLTSGEFSISKEVGENQWEPVPTDDYELVGDNKFRVNLANYSAGMYKVTLANQPNSLYNGEVYFNVEDYDCDLAYVNERVYNTGINDGFVRYIAGEDGFAPKVYMNIAEKVDIVDITYECRLGNSETYEIKTVAELAEMGIMITDVENGFSSKDKVITVDKLNAPGDFQLKATMHYQSDSFYAADVVGEWTANIFFNQMNPGLGRNVEVDTDYCGYSGCFITEADYNGGIRWEDEANTLYWVHAETMQGVIDKLLALDEKGTYGDINTGYIHIAMDYTPDVDEASVMSKQTVNASDMNGIVVQSSERTFKVRGEDGKYYDVYAVKRYEGEEGTVADLKYLYLDDANKMYYANVADTDGNGNIVSFVSGDIIDDSTDTGLRLKQVYFTRYDWEQVFWKMFAFPEIELNAPNVSLSGLWAKDADVTIGNHVEYAYIGYANDEDDIEKAIVFPDDFIDTTTGTVTNEIKVTGRNGKSFAIKYEPQVAEPEVSGSYLDTVTSGSGEEGGETPTPPTVEVAPADNSASILDVLKDLTETIIDKIIETGSELKISLNIDVVSKEETPAEKVEDVAAIETVIAEETVPVVADKVQFLDLTLECSVKGSADEVAETQTITDTKEDLAITIPLAPSMELPDLSQRTNPHAIGFRHVVYRMHNGKVDKLPGKLNDNKTYTFMTNGFSVYAIAIEEIVPTKIDITTAPTKTLYTEGDLFDKTGMVVTVTYSDGTTKAITDYQISKTTALATTDTVVTITYGDLQTSQVITVNAKPTPPADDKKDDTTAPTEDTTASTEEIVVPAKGTVISDQKDATYKVTKSGVVENGVVVDAEVEYQKPKASKSTVTIPKEITSGGVTYNVTSIGKNAFKSNKKLSKITIGSNVKTIGSSAFYSCKKLKTVKFGSNVTSIGSKAFSKCTALTKITISSKVKTIGSNAFDGCSKLKTVTLGKSVTSIGIKAFYKCTALTKITIPEKVTSIGKEAFSGCKKLKTITIKSKVLKSVGTKAINGIYKKATIKVPSSKLKAYKKLFSSKTGFKKTMKIKK